jgi:hypothetical protein
MKTEPERRAYPVPARTGAGPITTAQHLGALALLAGSWRGTGFSVMWRPDNPQSQPVGGATKRFLQLNLTSETLDFHVIPGQVPNRGLAPQTDLELYGLHYLQRVSDNDPPPYENAGQALHIEPGLFMNVPASNNYPHDTIVRMGSIPHGVTVLMQGDKPPRKPVTGAPHIPAIYPIADLPTFIPTPPPNGYGDYGLGIQPVDVPQPPPPPPTPPPPPPVGYPEHIVPEVVVDNDNESGTAPLGSMYTPTEQSNSPIAPIVPGGPGFPAAFQNYINDPNQVLRDAIAGQDILGTVTLNLSTREVKRSIAQIPFLGNPDDPKDVANTDNAFVHSATATFWIEWVKVPGYPQYDHHLERDEGDPLREIEPYLGERTYLQLQYSQTVILVFNQVFWPHVTVATLTLSAG